MHISWLYRRKNDENPKIKVGDHVRIPEYKKKNVKGYSQTWSEDVFVTQKVKNIDPWAYVFSDLNDEEIVKILKKRNSKNQVKKSF